MKVQAVPFPIHPPNQHISVNHQPGCVQLHWLLTVEKQCNQSVVLELLPFSILICSIGPKPIKVELTKISRKNPSHPSYLQSAWFLKQDYVLPCCRLHHLPELPQQHLTSPSHKELWKRSSSSHINLIPVLVSRAQGTVAHRVLPAWLCTHCSCSLEPGSWEGTGNRNLPVTSSKQHGIPVWGQLFLAHKHRTSFFQPHPLCLDWHTGGNPTLEPLCLTQCRTHRKGSLGAK